MHHYIATGAYAALGEVREPDLVPSSLALPYFDPATLFRETYKAMKSGGLFAIITDTWHSMDNCSHILMDRPWRHLLVGADEAYDYVKARWSDSIAASYREKHDFYLQTREQKPSLEQLVVLAKRDGFELLRLTRGVLDATDNERWLILPHEALRGLDDATRKAIYARNPGAGEIDLLTKFAVILLKNPQFAVA